MDAEIMHFECIHALREYIQNQGIELKALANISGLHVSNLCRILKHRYSPTLLTLFKLLSALNLTIKLERHV